MPEMPYALHALKGAYGDHLRGKPIRATAVPTPLLGILADEHGWRPDGLLRARNLLDGLLRTFAASPGLVGRRPRGTVESVLRMMWGVTGHPCGAGEARRRLGLEESERTIESWTDVVLRDPDVTAFANAAVDVSARGVVLSAADLGDRTAWQFTKAQVRAIRGLTPGIDTRPASYWPSTAWQNHRARDVVTRPLNEWQLLSDAVSRHFPGRTSDGHSLPAVADLAKRLSSDQLWLPIVLLRDVVGARLLDWFHGTEETEHEIWVKNNVLTTWFHDDPFTPLGPSRTAQTGGAQYPPAVAAATQMLMWQASADGSALLRAARVRELGQHGLTAFLRWLSPELGYVVAPGEDSGLPETWSDRQQLRKIWAGTAVDPDTVRAVETYLPLAERRDQTPFVALEKAIQLRNVADPVVQDVMAREYIANRPVVIENSRSDEDRIALALADQSAHWTTVLMGAFGLARHLTYAIQRQPAGAKDGYFSHTYRCMAVLANKEDRWGRALALICEGLDCVTVLEVQGVLKPASRERGESVHQLFLAGAGIAVRRLERAIELAEPEAALRMAQFALWFSSAAVDVLEHLDREALLLKDRFAENQISSWAWRAQTRIIRLRVLLAVRTAIESHLIGARQLDTDDIDLPPAAAGIVKGSVAKTSLVNIVAEYRALQHIQEVGAAHATSVVPLAAWVAFLNGGHLPVEDDPARAFVEACDVLGRRDDQLGQREIPLDILALAQWLQRNQLDALVLSWLPLNRQAARAIDRLSNGLFMQFRRQHRPTSRTHD